MTTRTVAVAALAIAVGVGAYVGRGLLTARATPAEPRTFAAPTLQTIAATVTTTGVVGCKPGADKWAGNRKFEKQPEFHSTPHRVTAPTTQIQRQFNHLSSKESIRRSICVDDRRGLVFRP